MATQPKHFVTVEEYLAAEETSLDRHEYLDGEVFVMSGASPRHGQIAVNILIELGVQLRLLIAASVTPTRGLVVSRRVTMTRMAAPYMGAYRTSIQLKEQQHREPTQVAQSRLAGGICIPCQADCDAA